jgi:hypothetical protein
MHTKKDKAKVLDEVWTEERIRGFLDTAPGAGIDPDFHTLLKAYQQMRADDFRQFIGLFVAQGRNINATDPRGDNLLDIVSTHRNSGEFAAILQDAGAHS